MPTPRIKRVNAVGAAGGRGRGAALGAHVLPFDVPADAEYGGIRSMLEAAEKPIGGNDLLIAAHAYTTGATIVTANTAEFKRIPGLNVENWLA